MSEYTVLEQQGSAFDITSLTPRAMNRVLQHGDQEAEQLYRDILSMARVGMEAERAFAISTHLTNFAANAAMTCPAATNDLYRLNTIAQQKLCDILESDSRR